MEELLRRKAQAAEEAEDYQAALQIWRSIIARAPDARNLIQYGSAAQKAGNWHEAEMAFSKALQHDPSSPLIMENIGSLWANRTDKSAVESFQTAKRWFLEALAYSRNARLLTQLGAVYQECDEFILARKVLQEAIKIEPDYEEALYNLAVIEEEDHPERSRELLENAIRIDPNYAAAHQALGRIYQAGNDLINAEYHFRRSLEIDPADYWSNLYLANLLGAMGRNVEAEETYRFAVNLHPEETGGVDLFARFLDSIGKQELASELRKSSGGDISK